MSCKYLDDLMIRTKETLSEPHGTDKKKAHLHEKLRYTAWISNRYWIKVERISESNCPESEKKVASFRPREVR